MSFQKIGAIDWSWCGIENYKKLLTDKIHNSTHQLNYRTFLDCVIFRDYYTFG